MENPATWDELTRAIDAAISEHEQNLRDGTLGLSLAAFIREKIESVLALQNLGAMAEIKAVLELTGRWSYPGTEWNLTVVDEVLAYVKREKQKVIETAARLVCPMCQAGIKVTLAAGRFDHAEHLQEPSQFGSWPFLCQASNIRMLNVEVAP